MKWNPIMLALCLALPGCRPKVPPPATPEEVRTLVMDSNRMALDFYRDLRGPGNMAFTPLGLCEPLTLLAWGADGTMREELQHRLHLTLPPERVPIALEAVRKQINRFDPGTYLSPGDQPPRLDFAMALWADRTNPVPWSTRRAVPVLMNAEASNLDFGGDRAGTRATMTQWSARHLGGLEVDADFGELPTGGFVLAATTSFGARWFMPFRPEMTHAAPFHRLSSPSLRKEFNMSRQSNVSSGINTTNATDVGDAIHRLSGVGLGLWLMGHGIRRGGLLGGFTVLAGALLGAHSISAKAAPAPAADAPTFPSKGIPAPQEPSDDIEEASMASFPASDPPSSHRSTATNPTF